MLGAVSRSIGAVAGSASAATLGRVALNSAMPALGAALPIMQRRGFFIIIQHSEQGQRLFLGQNPTPLAPGIRLNLPLLHHVKRVDMKERSLQVAHLYAYTKDNVPVTISGSLFFQVVDSHRAVFQVEDYENAVMSIGMSAARSTIGKFDYDDINGDRNSINSSLEKMIGNQIDAWGIKCTRFEIQDFSPQNDNVKRQLELQMEAERKRRENELNTSANVKTAEGLKTAKVLESEGELIAAQNAAQAAWVTTTKNAEASALEIKAVAESMGGDIDEAVKYLLETKRIQQLKAIALGKNNSVYVVPNDLLSAVSRVSSKLAGTTTPPPSTPTPTPK